MLTVGVDLNNGVISVVKRPPKPTSQGSANPKIHWQSQYIGTRICGAISSAVDRSVIYDADVVA